MQMQYFKMLQWVEKHFFKTRFLLVQIPFQAWDQRHHNFTESFHLIHVESGLCVQPQHGVKGKGRKSGNGSRLLHNTSLITLFF